MKKYKLTKEKKSLSGLTLFRIKALKDFGSVNKGELGGWIEKESNLSQEDNCWVSGDAKVSGNARVYGNARVFGDARVYGDAWVSGDSWVSGNCRLKDIKLCSRFNFSKQEEVEKWIKLEKEFELEKN